MATLTPLQVAAASYVAGFRGNALVEAVAVAHGESSFNTDLFNGSCCYGLFQVHKRFHEGKVKQYSPRKSWDDWKNPIVNAKVAHKIWETEGGWCRGKNPPNCNPYQAWGISNSGMTWAQKLAEGRKAKADLEHEYDKDRIKNILTFKSIGDTALKILRDAGIDTSGLAPITSREGFEDGVGGIGEGITNPLGEIGSALGNVNKLADALTDKDTWLRVAEVALGVVLIVVGLAKLVGPSAMNALPAGKIAKVLK